MLSSKRARIGLLISLMALAPALAAKGDVYQWSTIQALMEGIYEGPTSLGEVKQHGDMGIGTFNQLDGELVMDQGVVYQVLHTGEVRQPPDSLHTPFAVAHHFTPDLQFDVQEPIHSMEALKQWLDARLPSLNSPYGVRIRGQFAYVKTRSVPAAERPYPPLVEMAKRQNLFERDNLTGVLVGYRLPNYLGQVNVPGYHLHFLSDDHQFGGHLLELRFQGLTVEVDRLTSLHLELPDNRDFLGADFNRFSAPDLHRVESNPGAVGGAPGY